MKKRIFSTFGLFLLSFFNFVFGGSQSTIDSLPEVTQSINLISQSMGVIEGQVKSTQGDTLFGATVTILGTSTSVVANGLGEYTILLPYGSYTLRANYVGCVSSDIPVSVTDDLKTLNITLTCDEALTSLRSVDYDYIIEEIRPVFNSNLQRPSFDINYYTK